MILLRPFVDTLLSQEFPFSFLFFHRKIADVAVRTEANPTANHFIGSLPFSLAKAKRANPTNSATIIAMLQNIMYSSLFVSSSSTYGEKIESSRAIFNREGLFNAVLINVIVISQLDHRSAFSAGSNPKLFVTVRI